jgi:D-ribulokinase
MNFPLFVGVDVGTSGIRAIAIDTHGNIQGQSKLPLPPPKNIQNHISQDSIIWWDTLVSVLQALCRQIPSDHVTALSLNGTSATVLATDADGTPISPALMYNDQHCIEAAQMIANHVPANSGAQGASSSLAKLLWLKTQHTQPFHLHHQADWLSANLSGKFHISDENNCLKLGYNSQDRCWPNWLKIFNIQSYLPQVVPPGTLIGNITPKASQQTGLPESTQIFSGTTDSIAAFMATGAKNPGNAVTTLGSTLVLKVLHTQAIFSAKHGVYSHRLGDLWLIGGASNSGGAVLAKYFSEEDIKRLSKQINPLIPSPHHYYPLLRPGERFPLMDVTKTAKIHPVPNNPVEFLAGLLEGISQVEKTGYDTLIKLGSQDPSIIQSTGGGALNPQWTQIRQRLLNRQVKQASQTEAAYGSALLAKNGFFSQ